MFITEYTITMRNKGINLEYEKIQDVLRVIDFSSNRFEEKIPELVGSLKELHLLNLYYNALIGHIPSSLENLTNIELMELSQNKLFGEIPPHNSFSLNTLMSPTTVSQDLYHMKINLTHFRIVHLELIPDCVKARNQRNVEISSTLLFHFLPSKRIKAQSLYLNLVGK
jgi:hypothetical protein